MQVGVDESGKSVSINNLESYSEDAVFYAPGNIVDDNGNRIPLVRRDKKKKFRLRRKHFAIKPKQKKYVDPNHYFHNFAIHLLEQGDYFNCMSLGHIDLQNRKYSYIKEKSFFPKISKKLGFEVIRPDFLISTNDFHLAIEIWRSNKKSVEDIYRYSQIGCNLRKPLLVVEVDIRDVNHNTSLEEFKDLVLYNTSKQTVLYQSSHVLNFISGTLYTNLSELDTSWLEPVLEKRQPCEIDVVEVEPVQEPTSENSTIWKFLLNQLRIHQGVIIPILVFVAFLFAIRMLRNQRA